MVRIPEEYQEVEYLESTGTQWIDTGTTINNGCVISIDFYIADTAVNRILWGYRRDKTYQYPYQAYFGANSKKLKYIAFGIHSDNIPDVFDYDIRNSVVIDSVNKTIKVNDEIKDCYENFDNGKAFNLDGSSEYHPYLFALNAMGSELAISSDTKIYGYSVSYDGSFLQNFIPCYRKSDNEAGMYDTVSGAFYTSSGTGTFLVGNPVDYSTISLLEARRRILLNTPHLESLSGATASFETDISAKLKECKVYFSPVQEGTGDPSPDNVRPIHGWDGVTVTRCGKNLLNPDDENWSQYTITPTGAHISETDRICTGYISCNEGETYTFSGTVKGSNNYVLSFAGIAGFDENKEYVGRNAVNYVSKVSYTVPSGVKYIRAFEEAPKYPNITMKVWCNTLKRQLELSSTATDYEPYQGQSLTIPFPKTIYGGYVDLVKGEVVEEWEKITLDGVTTNRKVNRDYTNTASLACGVVYLNPSGKEDNQRVTKLLCENMTIVAQSQTAEYPYIRTISSGSQYLRIFMGPIGDYPDLDTARKRIDYINSYLSENPTSVCYPLRNPTTYSLTPQAIKALRGINTIWSDANGNITVSYFTH